MKTSELIKVLSARLSLPQAAVRDLLSHSADVMARLLEEDISFILPKLGTFSTRIQPERVSYHPGLKTKVLLPEKRSISFHPAAALKKSLKGKPDVSSS